MAFQFRVRVVVIPLDGRLLDRAAHPLDLAVGPRLADLREPLLDGVLFAGPAENAGHCGAVLLTIGELDSIANGRSDRWRSHRQAGEHGMDAVGQRCHETSGELRGRHLSGLPVQLDEGEFRGSVNRREQVYFSFFRTNFRNVDVEVSGRASLEFPLRFAALPIGQPIDPFAIGLEPMAP
nr:hypothetical protein [Poseidonocella sp. HB161398]